MGSGITPPPLDGDAEATKTIEEAKAEAIKQVKLKNVPCCNLRVNLIS